MNLKDRLFTEERAIEAEAEGRIVLEFDRVRDQAAADPRAFVDGLVEDMVNFAGLELLPRAARIAVDAAERIAEEAGVKAA